MTGAKGRGNSFKQGDVTAEPVDLGKFFGS